MGTTYTALALLAGGASAYGAAKATGVIGGGAKKLPAVPPMPSIEQTTQASTLQEAQAAALRQGRASTILTTPSDTGDKLGP